MNTGSITNSSALEGGARRIAQKNPGIRGVGTRLPTWWIPNLLTILFLLSVIMPAPAKLIGLKLPWGLLVLWLMARTSVRSSSGSASRGVRGAGAGAVFLIVLWMAVVGINAISGRGGSGRIHMIVAISMVMAAVMGAYSGRWGRQPFVEIITAMTLVLGVQAAVSLPTLLLEGGIARDLMEINAENPTGAGAEFGSEDFKSYMLRGVGDFNLYSALSILLPLMIGNARHHRGTMAALLWCGVAAITVSIGLSTFTAAFGMVVVGVVATLVLAQLNGKVTGVITAVGGGGFLVVLWLILSDSLQDVSQFQFVVDKLFRLVEGVSQAGMVDGDETMRGYLATISLNTVMEAPLFGVGPTTMSQTGGLYRYVGGHCSWLDQLAEYGVIGFGPFLAFVLVGTVKATRTFVSDRSAGNAGQVVFFLCVWLFGFANPLVFIESASIPVVLAICAIWTSPSWPSSRVRPAALVSGAVGKVGRVAAVDSESGLVIPSEDMRLGPLA